MGASMKAKLPVFATLGRAFIAVFSTRILLSGCFIKCLLAYFVANELHGSIYGVIAGLTEETEETGSSVLTPEPISNPGDMAHSATPAGSTGSVSLIFM